MLYSYFFSTFFPLFFCNFFFCVDRNGWSCCGQTEDERFSGHLSALAYLVSGIFLSELDGLLHVPGASCTAAAIRIGIIPEAIYYSVVIVYQGIWHVMQQTRTSAVVVR